jgi:hypothetical protein
MLNFAESFVGISDGACEVPEGWNEVAAENSRALAEMLLPGNLLINSRHHVVEIDATQKLMPVFRPQGT